MYEGIIIKETLTDELFLDYLTIDKVEICKTNNAIKYWTLIHFRSDTEDLPRRLADVILEGWFAVFAVSTIVQIIHNGWDAFNVVNLVPFFGMTAVMVVILRNND